MHNIKKLLVISLLLMCCPLCMAYETKDTPPMTPVMQQTGFNLGLQIGNTWQDWQHFTDTTPPAGFTWTDGTTHFNWSVYGGYQFNNHFLIEGGFLQAFTVVSPEGGIRAWTTYAAAMLMTPLYDSTGINTIFEAGLAYNHNTKGDHLACHYFSPLFAAGINFDITSTIRLDIRYIYLLGYHNKIDSGHQFTSPDSYIANIGVEYLFNT